MTLDDFVSEMNEACRAKVEAWGGMEAGTDLDLSDVIRLRIEALVNGIGQSRALMMAQYRSDLAGAHAEICKLQGLKPDEHSWPEWSPQANTLRWLDQIEAASVDTLQNGENAEGG